MQGTGRYIVRTAIGRVYDEQGNAIEPRSKPWTFVGRWTAMMYHLLLLLHLATVARLSHLLSKIVI